MTNASVLSKLFFKLYFKPYQFEFKSGHSTETTLLNVTNKLRQTAYHGQTSLLILLYLCCL